MKRIEVLGSYTVVSAENWRLALRRHPNYVPERKTLQLRQAGRDPEVTREYCRCLLIKAGLPAKAAARYSEEAKSQDEFYTLERCARLLQWMIEEEVLQHVAISLTRRVLDSGAASEEGRETLDNYEVALEVCRQKKRSGQALKNSAGLFIKLIKDEDTRRRLVNEDLEASLRENFRRREQAAQRQIDEAEERTVILEYEQFREKLARELLNEIPEARRTALCREKTEELLLKHPERFQRLSAEMQQREIEDSICQDLARKEAPSFERWRMRRRAQQAVLPFSETGESRLHGHGDN